MTSTRPYLIRAMYDWIVDNGMTPHLLVDTDDELIEVPMQYEQDGKIVLNVSPTATRDFLVDNDAVSFHARFDGKSTSVMIPMHCVLAIYTRENGQGMMFNENEELDPSPDSPPQSPKKPHLKVVK